MRFRGLYRDGLFFFSFGVYIVFSSLSLRLPSLFGRSRGWGDILTVSSFFPLSLSILLRVFPFPPRKFSLRVGSWRKGQLLVIIKHRNQFVFPYWYSVKWAGQSINLRVITHHHDIKKPTPGALNRRRKNGFFYLLKALHSLNWSTRVIYITHLELDCFQSFFLNIFNQSFCFSSDRKIESNCGKSFLKRGAIRTIRLIFLLWKKYNQFNAVKKKKWSYLGCRDGGIVETFRSALWVISHVLFSSP